jgi:hypothetical protein
MSSSSPVSSTHKKNSKRSGQEQEANGFDPCRQLFNDAAGTTPPTTKQSTKKTKKTDGPRESATKAKSILDMLMESPTFSAADDLIWNLGMIDTCTANIRRITQVHVVPAKESDNSTRLGINKALTTENAREERRTKNLRALKRGKNWHVDNIERKNNADLDTKLIAEQGEKIISPLEAELCKAHERQREFMAKWDASKEICKRFASKIESLCSEL